MAETVAKKYVGNFKKRDGKYGDFFTGQLDFTALQEVVNSDEYKSALREWQSNGQTRMGINVTLVERKEEDKIGNTHNMTIDTYEKKEA